MRLFGLLAILIASICTAQTVTDTSVVTHHDTIPRFALNTDVTAVQSGDWSDEATWGGEIPGDDDTVLIPEGITVRFESTAMVDAVEVFGSLEFTVDKTTSLKLNELMIMPGGELTIGTPDDPITASAEIVFRDSPLKTGTIDDPGIDPSQYGKGLLVFGTAIMHGRSMEHTFVRIDGDALVGSTTIKLQHAVDDWQVGDTIAIPDTRHVMPSNYGNYWTYEPQWETRTIKTVDGDRITLTEPLAFDHVGPRDADGTRTKGFNGETLAPHVANLSRNVTIRSENPSGVRGHTIAMGGAYKDYRYVAFESLGRTKAAHLDNTNAGHIGTNQVGRYSDHNHHVHGPRGGIDVDGKRYQCVTVGCSITDALKWGMTIHNTHYGLFAQNVVYDTDGSAIATEDGSETGNVIANNFVCRVANPQLHLAVTGVGVSVINDGAVGDGYWFGGPFNDVRDNVAANVYKTGFMFWPKNIASTNDRHKNVRVPLKPGDNTHMDGQYKIVNALETPVTQFAGNEVYGACTAGVDIWELGMKYWFDPAPPPTQLTNTTVWHVVGSGMWFYYTSDYVIDGWIQRGSHPNAYHHVRNGGPQNPSSGTAIVHGGASAASSILKRADIQGMSRGYINRGSGGSDELKIVDSYFDNHENIVVRPYQSTPADGSRDMVIQNVRFGTKLTQQTISLLWEPATIEAARVPESVTVLNHNGQVGANFDLFYEMQASDRIVPERGGKTLYPDGLQTNAAGFAKHGFSPAGHMIPFATAVEAKQKATELRIVGLAIPSGQVPPVDPDPPVDPPVDPDPTETLLQELEAAKAAIERAIELERDRE